jgi:hypothetical protein
MLTRKQIEKIALKNRDITKGLVRIDVSLRGESVSEDRITVRTEYDDVKMFVISAASFLSMIRLTPGMK